MRQCQSIHLLYVLYGDCKMSPKEFAIEWAKHMDEVVKFRKSIGDNNCACLDGKADITIECADTKRYMVCAICRKRLGLLYN